MLKQSILADILQQPEDINDGEESVRLPSVRLPSVWLNVLWSQA